MNTSLKLLAGMIVAILTVVIYSTQRPNWIIELAVDSQIEANINAQEISDTTFELLFCGTGSPQHHSDRGQPCLAIVAAGRLFLFDAGQGAAQRLNEFGAPILHLDTVFLTHLHSDHMSGLGEVLHNGWLYGRQHLVDVIGPPGTEKVLAGFQQVYEDDLHERQRVLGEEYLNSTSGMGRGLDVKIEALDLAVVYESGGVVIKAFQVNHPDWPYAYGYRIEYEGKTVVVSGDTAYTPSIGIHAKGADVLIHEALNSDLMTMGGRLLKKHGSVIDEARLDLISSVHTPTELVAKSADEADAGTLIVSHLIPPIPAIGFIEKYFVQGMDKVYDGEIIVARDGMRIKLID
ncbi:MAG: MBL fold metallo-hydrolase [Halioglobus sp.]